MTEKKTSSVFISHSSKDDDFVRWLAAELDRHGVEIWVDQRHLRPGDSLFRAIGDGLDRADRFIIVLTQDAVDSGWVEHELDIAVTREIDEKKPDMIIPVMLKTVKKVPTFIRRKKYVDFKSKAKRKESLRELLSAFGIEFQESTKTKENKPAARLYPNHFLPDLKFFVGREELLRQIKETLDKDHRAAIHDISGLGKTFTTYKFAHDSQGNYNHIFFIRATREEMLESLAKCGEMINPGLAEITEQQTKALGFKQWLEENEKWLVIYDNVDLPDELFKYVPVSKKGDCLFTSNFREVRNLGIEINIVKLDKADAEILLYSRANNKPLTKPDLNGDERAAFDRLIQEIDGLPLTLNSTGALIDKKQWSFADLWKRYERSTEVLWESEDKYSAYQRRSAGIVFSLTYDELCGTEKTGNAVKILLDSMSFISPDEILEALLVAILATQDESFAQMDVPDDLWDDVREKLTAYDLLKYDRRKKIFTTHRAIQRVIQSKLKGKEKDICIILASVLRGLFPEYDYSNREVCEKYYQHVLVLVENADSFETETVDTNRLYFRLGRYQYQLGNYGLAERSHLRAAEISTKVLGTSSEQYAIDLNGLALVYDAQGRYAEAIEKYEEALHIGESTIGRDHYDYAVRLNNLGTVYDTQGRYDEAIEKFEEALRIVKKTKGPEHPDYAVHLNNLANVYRAQGRHDEAIEKFEEALRINEKTIGHEHPYYAYGLNNLALVYVAQGRYDDAIKKCEEVLRIIGPDHPNYASGLNNLGEIYRAQGRYEEATKKFEEALRIGEKIVGKAHPDYAIRLNNLAAVYESRGKFQSALDLYKNALQIFEKTLPDGHPHIAQLRESVERCEGLVNRVD